MKTPLWIDSIKQDKNILVVPHWDSDGISSAALVTKYIKKFGEYKFRYAFPDIGTYNLIPKDFRKSGNIELGKKDFDTLIIVDYAVPGKDILNFKNKYNIPVVVFDHHEREPVKGDNIFYYNPVAFDKKNKAYPSCTWVVKQELNLEISDLVIIGIAGDLEERFLGWGFERFPQIKDYLEKNNRDYMDYVQAKELIDIHYKENDREILSSLVEKLIDMNGSPEKIMGKKDWIEKHKRHEQEMENILKQPPDKIMKDLLEVYFIDTDRNIISAVTRRRAANTNANFVIVVNKGFFDGLSQIYVRRANDYGDDDTSFFKKEASRLGASVGGKDDVAGIIIDNEKVAEYLKRVERYDG
ncbi:MAG: DHH family phosphoesterase [Elusimicrobiota bacterium]